jgi:RNA polymerase sigma-70 factor (ECF subfamily)
MREEPPPDPLRDDPFLLARFRRADPAALAEVYRLYSAHIARRLAHGFSFDSDGRRLHFRGFHLAFELDDMLQETFIRAFSDSARSGYDGARPFSTYLLAIAKNLLIDRFRKRGPTQAVSIEDNELVIVDEDQKSPEGSAADEQLRAIYQRFLQRLDEVDRQIVHLRFEEEKTRREICGALGISPMQLRWREQKLKKGLHDDLSAQGYAELCKLDLDALLALLLFAVGVAS